jgi:aminobenzoyl-glutamate transport protein
MLPYSIAFGVVWSVQLIVWYLLDLPLGPGAPIHLP